jgi:glucose/arabinose dehydrogenase
MNRPLPTLCGLFAIIIGCAVALLLRFLPPPAAWYWLFPVALLLSGVRLLGRARGWLWALGGCATFIAAALLVQFWARGCRGEPSRPVAAEGLSVVTVKVPAAWRDGFPAGRTLEAVPGWRVSIFAAGLEGPRLLAFSPAGDLYVSLPGSGRVALLPDRNHDGVADRRLDFASGLDRPHGLCFAAGALVVAENHRLVRLPDADHDLRADRVEVLSTDLPDGGGHWTRSVVTDRSGDFYVAAGSSCNACVERDLRRATILRIPAQGGKATVFARGLRNSVGLAFDPASGALWASDNGRDLLGDDLPPDEINRIVDGGDYGWPYCYGARIPDPELGSFQRCTTTLPAAVELPAHSAPLGIAFGAGLSFPERFRQMLLVAYHGSWNRSVPTGYKLVGIPFAAGRPSGPPQDLLRGWLEGASAWGRPVAPVVGPDGALYLSDDRAGVIYRITASSKGG